MGARKRHRADSIKEEKANKSFAILRNCPTSPRKMRLVADIIRGVNVNRALDILKFSAKHASIDMEGLLRSALANWQAKNEGLKMEEQELYVSEVFVDAGRVLKRLRPAPQGRGYRIRKRSNHVTLVVDSKNNNIEQSDNE